MDNLKSKLSDRRVVIISNRLPVSISKQDNKLEIIPSSGGLATGLASFHRDNHGLWLGWPGYHPSTISEKERLEAAFQQNQCHPVYLSNNDIKKYYNGFSNNALWPLFHYFTTRCTYDNSEWEAYREVNQKFCDQLLKVVCPNDIIWVHDYHLLLLPELIRDKLPEATIGLFLHIPFPSMEVFRYLPWRNELLSGMLGADLIGFHTYDYTRHFLSCVLRIAGKEHQYGQLIIDNRLVKVDTFPMGIDAQKFAAAVNSPEVEEENRKLRSNLQSNAKLIISVDRMDFTKGIPERIKAYELFLEKHPEWHGKVNYIMLCVPSRDKIHQYQLLKKEVDELVGRLNGRFGTPGWSPLLYMYRSVSFEALISMYSLADLALVTPLRDGMNLVSKEYLACQGKTKKGVIVLSETAGSAAELGEAILINPNNLEKMAEAIHEGLTLPEEQKISAIDSMVKRIHHYHVFRWAEDFVEQLIKVKETQEYKGEFLIKGQRLEKLCQAYIRAKKRLILLNYDGTLVSGTKRTYYNPDAALLELLQKLIQDPANRVVILSGRSQESLTQWFGETGVELVAEHGVWIREAAKGHWELREHNIPDEWKTSILPILERFAERTPGAFIEEKSYSLIWNFRKSLPELGSLRSKELIDALQVFLAGTHLSVHLASKMVEIKPVDVNNGKAAAYWLEKGESWDFILAIGDNNSDEEIFAVMPESAWSIKVGIATVTKAKYFIDSPAATRQLLAKLTETSVIQ